MIEEKRTCIVCGEEFEPKTHNHKICSQRCAKWRQIDADYFSVFYRDRFRCRYCGKTPADGIKLTIDHVYPRGEGGTEDKVNLVTACENCNRRKGQTVWEEDLIKEIWFESKKLSQRRPRKDCKEMLKEFEEKFPDIPIQSPKPVSQN